MSHQKDFLVDDRLKIGKILDEVGIKEPKLIYYPGMGEDIYTPFVLLGAEHVVAIDSCYGFFKQCKDSGVNSQLILRFMKILNEIRDEIRSILTGQILTNSNSNKNSNKENSVEGDGEGEWITNIEFDTKKFYFKIEFKFNGKMRCLEYWMYQFVENFWPPRLDKVDLILAKGVPVNWKDFLPKIKSLWIKNTNWLVTTKVSEVNNQLIKDWSHKQSFELIYPLKLRNFDTLDTMLERTMRKKSHKINDDSLDLIYRSNCIKYKLSINKSLL